MQGQSKVLPPSGRISMADILAEWGVPIQRSLFSDAGGAIGIPHGHRVSLADFHGKSSISHQGTLNLSSSGGRMYINSGPAGYASLSNNNTNLDLNGLRAGGYFQLNNLTFGNGSVLTVRQVGSSGQGNTFEVKLNYETSLGTYVSGQGGSGNLVGLVEVYN